MMQVSHRSSWLLIASVYAIIASPASAWQQSFRPRRSFSSRAFIPAQTSPAVSRAGSPGPFMAEKRFSQPSGLMDDEVPEEQQPVVELQQLKQSPFFGWAQLPAGDFTSRLGLVWGAAFLFVSLPISATSFEWSTELPQLLLAANIGGVGVLFAFLVRMYIGWSYVGDRLKSSVFVYEETGWYDGAMKEKPEDMRARDQMLYQFEVSPAVDKIKGLGLKATGAVLVSLLLFKLCAPVDPDEIYSTGYLQELNMSDEQAEAAQKRAIDKLGNKPAYCGSRYYKAMAGGESMCN